ncbi:MAG TPA: DUF4383 domain-containing protein [Acidimicrobiales bacterium]|nr:DUF4383 domain-containing protein [Acidimicrobiales bacterium]
MSYEFQGRTRAKVEEESGRRRPARERVPRERPATDREPRTPMHAFAAAMGLVFLLAGIGGFIPGVTTNYDELEFAGPESGAKLLGLFEVSVLHNIVHLLFAVGLIAAARYSWSRAYLLGGGVGYLGVVVYGALVDRESDANVLPINNADNILHLVLALTMIGLAVLGARLSQRAPATR